jgi:parallel beta-helix repeat protein
VVNNIISGNIADEYGGGFHCYSFSSPAIRNNIIVNNSAVYGGGGIDCSESSTPSIGNNIIFGNTASSNGGGINCRYDSAPNVTNNIIRDNSPCEIYIHNSSPTITYCNVDGGWEGEGNIDVEPLFRDPINDDYHLMSIACGDSLDSPCIDAGAPLVLDSLLDCSWGLGEIRSDMGAYGGGDTTIVNTNVINVPGDYPTIQLAIDASSDGDTVLVQSDTYYENDTVLVQSDTYYENINFNGHNTVVGSMYMMTGDPNFISSTIIDGGGEAPVVTIDSGEDETARIIGFTIQNGFGNHGAGIYCQESDPVISNNIIKENDASGFGGGILCLESSSIIMNNVLTGNIANQGAAICCMESRIR